MKHKSFGGRRKPSNFRRKRNNKPKKNVGSDIQILVDNQTHNVATSAQEYVCKHKFDDFKLSPKIKLNIAIKGYKNPTPIQDQTIPFALEGKDIVGIANTGTGKTVAFLLPLLNKVLADRNQKVLILAPTRELAFQIEDEFKTFAQNLSIRSVLCIGGMSMNTQIYQLKKNFNFIIGTPGRVKDMIGRRLIKLEQYASVVLDEVDRMLDIGFIKDIREILSGLPARRQSLFFSATVSAEIQELISQFLNNPLKISVASRETAVNVQQKIIKVSGKDDKINMLKGFLVDKAFEKVLVFGRTKYGVDKLCRVLEKSGFKVDSIHGNKSQRQRQRALDKFKKASVRVLVATDVAARGLDIDNVSHVVNYDLPESREDYIHRIGRTGRGEKKGVALTFVS